MKAILTIENISPDQARLYLENIFEGQRKVRGAQVAKLAHDIREGRFRLSPDCLVIAKGKLANGQHRLHAVIESGMACEFIVMRTEDDQLYTIIDTGSKRTVADCFVQSEHAKCAASIARFVVQYDRGMVTPLGDGGCAVISRNDIVDYMAAHIEELTREAALCKGLYSLKPIMPVSLGGTLLHLGSRRNRQKAEEFIRCVYDGSSRDDAAFDVRERIIRNQASKSKLPRTYILGLLIKAFKSFITGTRPGALRIHDGEKFPTI